jgi:hypothetical protein
MATVTKAPNGGIMTESEGSARVPDAIIAKTNPIFALVDGDGNVERRDHDEF